jgi:Protein of unknown function (DUF2911)/Caspase domain
MRPTFSDSGIVAMVRISRFSLFVFTAVVVVSCAEFAAAQQIRLPRPSQKSSVAQAVGGTSVSITYSRPRVNGRQIWGDPTAAMLARARGEATLDDQNARKRDEPIVPWGHVWRAGANEATLFVVTDDVLINGQKLPAGRYSLHTIPNPDEWTIIFNGDPDAWGSFVYDPAKDRLRVKVKPQWTTESQEWLMYSFDAVTDTSAQVNIRWEKVRVPFTVQAAAATERQTAAQRASLTQTVGVSDLTINYSSRPNGLNEDPQFSISDDVLINGERLRAGSYNLRVLPGSDDWTLAFNDPASPSVNSLQMRLRPSRLEESTARPQFLSPRVTPNSADFQLRSEKTGVSFTVEVPNVEALTRAKAEALMAANPSDERLRQTMSGYYAGVGNWSEALKWIEQSIRIKATFRNLSAKANYLHSAGRTDEALSVAALAISQGRADRVDTASFEKRVADMRSSPARPVVAMSTATPEITIPSRPATNPATSMATPEVTTPARILRQEPSRPSVASPVSGRYYALVIGNDRYQFVPGLKMAVADAREVASVLEKKFGFMTQLLLNAKRQEIITAINGYRRNLDPGDSLLVYYAGHGYYDREIDRAYWLPVDASKEDNANWISADDITGNIRGVSAKHVMIVSDSCYSGAISRELVLGSPEAAIRSRFLEKMMSGKSRTLMSSGGNEPVSDAGGSGHSVFARAFLTGLDQLDKNMFTATELFRDFVQERVAGGAMQTPEYNPLRNSGHESGDFVFVRK